MLRREIEEHVLSLARGYPVVTVTGPRQSGKTTLVRMLFPEYDYVNLEIPDIREEARRDPRGFLMRHAAPVVLDEIQHVPHLLSYIQADVDEVQRKGMYILTGSHQPELQAAITQSLAGRTGVAELLPLSIREWKAAGVAKSRDQWMLDGFMPRLAEGGIDATQLYRDYFRTYVERDARQLINLRDLHAFEMFVRLLAGRVGQVLNLSSLAGDIGVSSVTLRQWLTALEASYVVTLLRPYYRNFGKRLIKSPKVYFIETGLAAYLLGLRTAEQVGRDPLLGNLFENMVVMEAIKARLNAGKDSDLYFFRDSQGVEVDLLLASGRDLYPFEIKAAFTPSDNLCRSVKRFAGLSGEVMNPSVIYAGRSIRSAEVPSFLNFEDAGGILRDIT
ncbi:MAG: ATP-binding protein [Kiritimatiellae bacterium]|nr:ATP-binding protein [Kiritimatiellia bacterium]